MATVATRRLAAVIAVAAAVTAARADDPKQGAAAGHKLVGTWKCVAAKYNGPEVERPAGYTQIKHGTPAQFMWSTSHCAGKVESAVGGPCAVRGEEYVETPEYGVGPVLDQLKGKAQVFKWRVEGNRWYHTGKLSSGLTIEEVWERVETK